jgi:hypothetical protein
VGVDCVTPLGQGLSLIISHFEKPVWPRNISTYDTDDRQVLVYNYEEALARFYQANLLNCKISAYPPYTDYHGINRQSPNFIFIDLDLSHFRNTEALDTSLSKTLNTIKKKLNCAYPSVLWSGNGYHIYLPVEASVLEQESIFAELDEQPSRRFIQWAEKYLSNNKSDHCHSSGLSFKNCMLRIPGSYNSKHGHNVEVKIVQKWNGVRSSIAPLLSEFYIYLADTKIEDIRRIRKPGDGSIRYAANYENNKIRWIEMLLQMPIADHRKYALWRILAPYLINIKKLPYEDALSIISVWLRKCAELKPLDFRVNSRIKPNLSAAGRVGYLPISFSHLKTHNRQLADLISYEMKNE